MRTFKQFINEGKEKTLKIKVFYSPKDFDYFYTKTNGKRYLLNDDGSVYMEDDKKAIKDMSVDGVPSSKVKDYDVMEINGKLGVYDSDLKLIEKFKNRKDLEKNISDFLKANRITLLNWE